MHVAELWRFPVKSLRGERLASARIDAAGVPGDRFVQVYDDRDRLVTARTHPRMLALAATLGPDGEPLVEGTSWRGRAAAEAVREAAGEGTRMERRPDLGERFDDTPLLVGTDGAMSHLGLDGRRFRPNLLIAGVEGLAERDWPGRRLRAGEAVISAQKLCRRCVMPTYDPDTLDCDPDILRRINAELDHLFALNCFVERAGRVAEGDPVELL